MHTVCKWKKTTIGTPVDMQIETEQKREKREKSEKERDREK